MRKLNFYTCLWIFRRDLTTFLKRQQRFSEYVDPDEGNGELTISIPESLQKENSSTLNDENTLNDIVYKVTIDFSVEQPECGIHFFIPDDDTKLARVSWTWFSWDSNRTNEFSS